jgi:hypothetical protein
MPHLFQKSANDFTILQPIATSLDLESHPGSEMRKCGQRAVSATCIRFSLYTLHVKTCLNVLCFNNSYTELLVRLDREFASQRNREANLYSKAQLQLAGGELNASVEVPACKIIRCRALTPLSG